MDTTKGVILFFWTEKRLLTKINLFLSKVTEEGKQEEELYVDIGFLTHLFTSMQERYYQTHYLSGITFIPTQVGELEIAGYQILKFLTLAQNAQGSYASLLKIIPKKFIPLLHKRLSQTSH